MYLARVLRPFQLISLSLTRAERNNVKSGCGSALYTCIGGNRLFQVGGKHEQKDKLRLNPITGNNLNPMKCVHVYD